MARTGTVRFRTPAPTSIDEELAVYDDGTALLAVRRPAEDPAAIGTFATTVSPEERALLEGQRVVDLLEPGAEDDGPARETALAVARRARGAPRAVARFHVRVVPVGSSAAVALAVVGEGTEAVRFRFDPASFTVHFDAGGSPLSWVPAPAPATGFVTADAATLGGLHDEAVVEPATMGALSLTVDLPDGADAIGVKVAGTLVGALPDAPMPEPFLAATGTAPLG